MFNTLSRATGGFLSPTGNIALSVAIGGLLITTQLDFVVEPATNVNYVYTGVEVSQVFNSNTVTQTFTNNLIIQTVFDVTTNVNQSVVSNTIIQDYITTVVDQEYKDNGLNQHFYASVISGTELSAGINQIYFNEMINQISPSQGTTGA